MDFVGGNLDEFLHPEKHQEQVAAQPGASLPPSASVPPAPEQPAVPPQVHYNPNMKARWGVGSAVFVCCSGIGKGAGRKLSGVGAKRRGAPSNGASRGAHRLTAAPGTHPALSTPAHCPPAVWPRAGPGAQAAHHHRLAAPVGERGWGAACNCLAQRLCVVLRASAAQRDAAASVLACWSPVPNRAEGMGTFACSPPAPYRSRLRRTRASGATPTPPGSTPGRTTRRTCAPSCAPRC